MKNIKRETLTKLYNLSRTEIEIISVLWKTNKGFDLKQLVLKLKKDRSTLQRCIKNLHRKNLVEYEQVNTYPSSFKFVYYADEEEFIRTLPDKIEIEKSNLDKLLKDWRK